MAAKDVAPSESIALELSPDASAPLVERVLAPFRRFARTASSSGIVLLAATAIADRKSVV